MGLPYWGGGGRSRGKATFIWVCWGAGGGGRLLEVPPRGGRLRCVVFVRTPDVRGTCVWEERVFQQQGLEAS